MRKRIKKKRRSCPMCNPHKTGGANRWSAKDRDRLDHDEKEIKKAVA